jgi:hypothetical protein
MRKSMLGVGCLMVALVGCNSQEPESDASYLEGVPEQAALQLQITEDAANEALAGDEDAVASDAVAADLGQLSAALEGDIAEGLHGAQQGIRELNQALRNILGPIVAMVRNTEPDEVQANVAQWGPTVRGATEYRLFVRKGALKRYGWLLQARPEGSDGAYANVAAGSIAVGEVVRRGVGTIGVDLDAFGAVDPTVAARGKILGSFAHGPRGTVLAYALKDFTRGEDDTTPISAAFQGVHLPGGYNRVRLAFHGNLPESASEAEELLLARVRHHRGEGGRADVLVMGGDVADGRVWVASECWDREDGSTFRAVLDCPGDGPGGDQCTVVNTWGDRTACARDLREAELPPLNPEEHMDDSERPEADLLPPDQMPSGDSE